MPKRTYSNTMSSTEDEIFSTPRVDSLALQKIYERIWKQTSEPIQNNKNDQLRQNIFQYELSLRCKIIRPVVERVIEENSGNDNPDLATMMNHSILKFDGNHLLGLVPDSLILIDEHNTKRKIKELDQSKLNHITIRSNVVNDSISIYYFMNDVFTNYEIKFQLVMKSPLDINLMGQRNIIIQMESHKFHRNGYTTNTMICDILHEGFEVSSSMNELERNIAQEQFNQEITLDQLVLPSKPIGGSTTTEKRYKPSSLMSSIFDYFMPYRGKILMFIEYLHHPKIMIYIENEKTVASVKQIIQKTVDKLNYPALTLSDIRLLYNTELLKDEQTLSEIFKNQQRVLCAIAKRNPSLPSRILTSQSPETQIQEKTLQRFRSCWILHRNLQACNSATEAYLEPNDRLRFNQPAIPCSGIIHSEDLGILVVHIADEIKRLSINLSKLSHGLVQDKDLRRGSLEYNNYKKLIQNSMDAARYAGPLLKALSGFVIPLAQSCPRQIQVIPG